MHRQRPLSIYLVAAEESGDALGAALGARIAQRCGRCAGARRRRWAGDGGRGRRQSVPDRRPRHCRGQCDTGTPAADPAAHSRNRRRGRRRAARMRSYYRQPRFHPSRCAPRARARAHRFPIIDYVSPTVWAWRSGRARAMRAYVDCVLAILPFEPAAPTGVSAARVRLCRPSVDRAAGRPAAGPHEAERRRAARRCCWSCPAAARVKSGCCLRSFGEAIAEPARRCRRDRVRVADDAASGSARRSRRRPAGRVKPRIVTEPAEKWAAFAVLARRWPRRHCDARTGACWRPHGGRLSHSPWLRKSSRVPAQIKQRLASVISPILCWRKYRTGVRCNMIARRSASPRRSSRYCPMTPEWRRQIDAFAASTASWRSRRLPSARAAAVVLEAARAGAPRTDHTAVINPFSLPRISLSAFTLPAMPRVIGSSLRSTGE